jgi:ABC-type multidrug transport system ATPase subunit
MTSRDVIIILSTHIVGDISSTCSDMALMDRGTLAYKGSPDKLIEMAKSNVWKISATEDEYRDIQEKYPIISSIPSEIGWDVQVVSKSIDGYAGEQIEPNLEHAYVNFMENELNQHWHDI